MLYFGLRLMSWAQAWALWLERHRVCKTARKICHDTNLTANNADDGEYEEADVHDDADREDQLAHPPDVL